jgi:putative endonuclease
MKRYYTYIIYSDLTGRYYTVITDDLERRLHEHNSGRSRTTSRGVTWKIMFYKDFGTRSEATTLEKRIKKRGAKRFIDDINGAIG